MSETRRELKNLLDLFARKLGQWEWSDIVKWLKKVESCLLNFDGDSIPCKRTLARRLTQCLNPNLPQGPHFVTLKILHRILELSKHKKEDMALFSSGLFPFFEYATPENKENVLRIIEFFFLPLQHEVSFAIPGIVTALLPSMNDVGSANVERKISAVLESLSQYDFPCLMDTIAQALLNNPRIRQGALMYLQKTKPETLQEAFSEALFVRTIIVCLDDENIMVRKAVLDLIKSHFPINSESIEDDHKQEVLAKVFSLLKGRDSNMTRRVWEWCFQEEGAPYGKIFTDFWGVAEPVLTNMLETIPTDPIGPLVIINALLDYDELIQPVFESLTEYLLTYAQGFSNKRTNVATQVVNKTIELITKNSDHYTTIYGALEDFLIMKTKNIGDTKHAIEVIQFFFDQVLNRSVLGDDINVPHIIPILSSLLGSIHMLSEEAKELAYELIKSVLEKFEVTENISLGDEIENYYKLFNEICTNQMIDSIPIATEITILLAKYTQECPIFSWVDSLLNLAMSDNTMLMLLGIEFLVKLLARDEDYYEVYKNRVLSEESIVSSMVDKLWTSLIFDSDKSVTIIFEIFSKFPQTVLEKIERESDISLFNIFWDTAAKIDKKVLRVICEEGTGIFKMIDFLDHSDPAVRHRARDWFIESLEEFTCMIDPLFRKFLSQINIEYEFPHYYIDSYDFALVADLFKKLRAITSTVSHLVFAKAKRPLSKLIRSMVDSELTGYTYLQLMAEIPVKFISSHNSNPAHQSIRAESCEYLCLVLSQQNKDLAFQVADTILESLQDAKSAKDRVIEMLLLSVIEVIFFRCGIQQDSIKLSRLMKSKVFVEVYVNSITTSDPYLRTHWVTFVSQSFYMLVKTIRPHDLFEPIKELINNFCHAIKETNGSPVLFAGLRSLIHESFNLQLSEDIENLRSSLLVHNYPELMKSIKPKDTSLIDDLFKIFRSEDSMIESRDAYEGIRDYITQLLPAVISRCVSCLEDFEDSIRVTEGGTPSYEFRPNVESINNDDVLDFFKPMLRSYPKIVLILVFNIWSKITIQADFNVMLDENFSLRKLLRLLISVRLPPKDYLEIIQVYLAEDLQLGNKRDQKNTENKEVSVAHFLYSLICYYPSDWLGNDIEIWPHVLSIVKLLDCSSLKIMSIWNMEILNLFFTRYNYSEFFQEKRYAKELREFTQRLIAQVSTLSISDSSEAVLPPFSPSTFSVFGGRFSGGIDLVSVICLDSCLYTVVSISWRDDPAKVIQQITGQLLQSVINPSTRIDNRKSEILSQFLGKILRQVGIKLIKVHKKEIVEYIASHEFYGHLVGKENYLEHWAFIFNLISSSCYIEAQLVDEILGKIQTGLFTSKETETIQKAQALKCISFLLYSGKIDTHSASLMLLSEVVKEYMKTEYILIPSVFFSFRVMIYTFSQTRISEIWPNLWPHILMLLNQIIISRDNWMNYLACLKLLQFLILANNEEFHLFEWIFFYTDSQNPDDGYKPLIYRIFNDENIGYPDDENSDFLIREYELRDFNEAKKLTKKLIFYTEHLKKKIRVSDRTQLKSLIEEEFLSEFL